MDANSKNTAAKQDIIDIIENIYILVNKYHNPDLIKSNDSPNSNIITHIYSDGEITEQKGGFAYLQRSERTTKCPISNIDNGNLKILKLDLDITKFPKIKVNGNSSKFGYAIVLEKHANEIRNEMLKLVSSN